MKPKVSGCIEFILSPHTRLFSQGYGALVKRMEVRLAVKNIPWNRRRQTLALATHVFSIPLFMGFFMLCCAFPPFWPFIAIYLFYMANDSSYEDGSPMPKRCFRIRQSRLWQNFGQYFPITLHKTVDLVPAFVPDPNPPERRGPPFVWKLTFWWYYYLLKPQDPLPIIPTGKKYIFGYHPHGIISMGLIGGIATEGAGWSNLFPGIPVRALTLKSNFRLPFYREYLLSLGLGSVARDSCENLLDNNQPICIVVGGAQESLKAVPGKMELVLNKRHGFVKLALEAKGDVDLVPVIAFGENDLYEQVEGSQDSILSRFQQWLKQKVGFTLPLSHARGIFNYDLGIIPYRRPINIVVGSPITVPHIAYPSKEDVLKYHSQYVRGLNQLFEDNKRRFYHDYSGKNKSAEDFHLKIVE